ncbi:hypothetical protein T190607A01A_30261 [Tenacibaculum sp. 190524A05c]|uniref:DUF4372 domain-containing protein n=1 Tax=Tenacibaculum platacis TaxID=3137852 RepID=A0ABM9P389_9FLAO
MTLYFISYKLAHKKLNIFTNAWNHFYLINACNAASRFRIR